jgi:peptide chain release factor 3
MTYRWPRWVSGPKAEVERVASGLGRMQLFDHKGNVVVLFQDQWALRRALTHETGVTWHETAP